MNKKEIREVITARLKAIKKYCRKIEKNYDDEDIHAFRIEVKKLRAFLRLISLEREVHKPAQLPNKLKKINAAAGAIRDLHLHRKRIKAIIPGETGGHQKYMRLLEKQMKAEKQKLGNILKHKPWPGIEEKIKSLLPVSLSAETINRFISDKFIATEALITGPHDTDEDMHSIRKNLKDVLYDVKSLRDQVTQGLSLLDEGQLKIIEQLAQKLGDFNDMTLALLFMEPSYLDKLKAGEKAQLLSIKEKWMQEKEELRKDAMGSLKDAYPVLHTQTGPASG